MRPRSDKRWAGFWSLVIVYASTASRSIGAAGSLELINVDAQTHSLLPSRIHLSDENGKPVRAPGLPFWSDHFVCTGAVTLALPPGAYRWQVERGPEWSRATGAVTVAEALTATITNELHRVANLSSEGWWSGETHVHRRPAEAELLMRAEDLHVAQFISWWNKSNPWTNQPLPRVLPVRFDDNRFYHPLGGEDERDGGALLYLDLPQPIDITAGARHFPSSLVYARQARERGARWLEVEKPFWWDFPLWLAHGMADTVGLAHNHMHRGGVLGNEAWGRPRDDGKFSGALANGYWTQEIYYHALNCGIRLPPSAGSASGVLPNPVGYNRVYVHVDGEFSYEKWRDGLKAGRSFVSNGPLLRARANGQLPGHVFKADGPLTMSLAGELTATDPITSVELVHNGHVERIALGATDTQTFSANLTIRESGWFLVRSIADLTNTFRFASTAPFYVEIAGRSMVPHRESARFFIDWGRERMAKLQALADLSGAQKDQLIEPWREAERFWQGKTAGGKVPVTGQVIDAATGRLLPCRLYLRKSDGSDFFPLSTAPSGKAVPYEKQSVVNRRAVERHSTLSAHPWRVDLEPGRYTVTIERGKEYRTLVKEFIVDTEPMNLELPLVRWVDMASRGWYSGDTHVHRTRAELPNVMLAEDLNVALPLTYWTTRSGEAPSRGNKTLAADAAVPGGLTSVDDTHVIWPRNTEWEIFTVDGKAHTLGAVFALGHHTAFTNGVPPLGPMLEAARRDGAIFDLDKHDWPWALALVPLLNVDLYELANNHVWRTEFGYTNWSSRAAPYMGLPNDGRFGNERDWLEYTHRTYWTLLDCGFRLRPTAGTASGVHPVPLGFSRAYVRLADGFRYDHWMKGLNEGRSFVTTGPMLFGEVTRDEVTGTVISQEPVAEVEVIVNGEIRHRVALTPGTNKDGAREAGFRQPLKLTGTSWVALRCWEPAGAGRERFAHTAPQWFEVADSPLRPRKEEAEYLVHRVREQIERSKDVLPAAAIEEYRKAQTIFEGVLRNAR